MTYAPTLRYDPTRLTEPQYQIDPNRPPCVPNVLIEAWLQPYIPHVAAALSMEITGNAQRSYLRAYMFNQYSRGHFNNQDFAELTKFALEYISMQVGSVNNADVAQIVQAAIPMITELACAKCVQEDPGLTNYLTQEEYQAAALLIQEADNTRAYIRNYRVRAGLAQQAPIGHGQHGQIPGQAPRGYPHNVQYSAHPHTRVDPRLGGGYRSVPPGAAIPRAGVGGVHRPLNQPQDPLDDLDDSRFTGIAGRPKSIPVAPAVRSIPPQPFAARLEPIIMNAEPIERQAVIVSLVPEYQSERVWGPSEAQVYRPAWRPSKEMRFHEVINGDMLVTVVKEKDPTMEYDKHSLGPTLAPERDGVGIEAAKCLEKFSQGVRELNLHATLREIVENSPDADEVQKQAYQTGAMLKHVHLDSSRWRAEISETTLWLNAQVERMALSAAGKEIDIFHYCGILASPIIHSIDGRDFMRKVMDCSTYDDLAEFLSAQVGIAEPKLLEAVNKRLTILVNRVLNLHLSIPKSKTRIDDFVNDVEDLPDYLGEHFGATIQQAFCRRDVQALHLASIFQELDEDIIPDFDDMILGDKSFPEGGKPFITYLAANITYSYLNVNALDLDLNLDADTGSQIREEAMSELFIIINYLFNEMDERKMVCYRHLFQTNDGVILEVVKGDITAGGPPAYLMSKVVDAWAGA